MDYPKRFRSRYTKATIKALKASIKTWKRRVKGEYIFPDTYSCALCARFNEGDKVCEIDTTGERCPVFAKTGKTFCDASKTFLAYSNAYTSPSPNLERLKKLARAEVKFLTNLLPVKDR